MKNEIKMKSLGQFRNLDFSIGPTPSDATGMRCIDEALDLGRCSLLHLGAVHTLPNQIDEIYNQGGWGE